MSPHVWSVPMTTRFRGITVREGVLLEGPGGWGEWSPFLEYAPAVAEPWLRCAEEAAAGDWPAPLRDRVPVNVTVPSSLMPATGSSTRTGATSLTSTVVWALPLSVSSSVTVAAIV